MTVTLPIRFFDIFSSCQKVNHTHSLLLIYPLLWKTARALKRQLLSTVQQSTMSNNDATMVEYNINNSNEDSTIDDNPSPNDPSQDDPPSDDSPPDAAISGNKTVSQTNTEIRYITKCDFCVFVEPNENNLYQQAIEAIVKLIQKIKDNTFYHLHPWKPYHRYSNITWTYNIPQDWDLLEKYLPDFTSRPSGGFIYSKFWLGTSVPLEYIFGTKSWKNYCKNGKCGIYEWTVQSASTIRDAE
jgi:hypothetical protein